MVNRLRATAAPRLRMPLTNSILQSGRKPPRKRGKYARRRYPPSRFTSASTIAELLCRSNQNAAFRQSLQTESVSGCVDLETASINLNDLCGQIPHNVRWSEALRLRCMRFTIAILKEVNDSNLSCFGRIRSSSQKDRRFLR